VAAYFSDYPDQCHHPKEDLVYGKLRRRDPASSAGLYDLLADHRRLHELTERFATAVRQGDESPDAVPATKALLETLREFTVQYRQHMQMEEEQFFPLAEKRLSEGDWEAIDFDLFDRNDPLFDHAAEERFAVLKRRIDGLAGQAAMRQAAFDAATGLKGLSGIESFNASMKAAGRPFRLTRFTKGGYTLEDDSGLLLYIPKCSAERATWCAFFFLRGRSS
jgi:hemerythrin-like domain-containing protein